MNIEHNRSAQNPVEKKGESSGIETEIAQAEQDVQSNLAELTANMNRLPEPDAITAVEYPGLQEKLKQYKANLLSNKEFFMTKLGLISGFVAGPAMGLIASQGGMSNIPATLESGLSVAVTSAAVGLVVAAFDQIIGRVDVFLETNKQKESLLRTN